MPNPNIIECNVFDNILCLDENGDIYFVFHDGKIKFFGDADVTGVSSPATITGVAATGTPTKQILTVLSNLGLIVDNTTTS